MFSYLRRDHHRGHKEDKDRRPVSPPHHTRPRTSQDKAFEHETEEASNAMGPVDPDFSSFLKENASFTHDSPAKLLPPLSAPPLFDSISRSISWLETPPDELQSKKMERRPKTSSKMASSMSLSRGISRQLRKEKPSKVDPTTQKLSSLSLSLGRPQTSPPAKNELASKDQSPQSKPSSPWRLAFGSSRIKDNTKISSAIGSSASNSGASHKTSLSKESKPSTTGFSHSKASLDPSYPQDGQPATMPDAHPSTTKASHLTSQLHHPHDGSSKDKRRLNLLNPMALLARRRSGQNSAARQEEMSLPELPDDYDPRIRGKYIHDFSSPRQRNPPPLNIDRANELIVGNDLETLHAYEVPLPATATVPFYQHHSNDVQESNRRFSSALPVSMGSQSLHLSESTKGTDTVPVLHPGTTSPENYGVTTSVRSKASSKRSALGIPNHAPSNSSRFSFDMGGGEPSAQERLLEEKHKEKEAEDRAKRIQERIQNPHIKRDSESTFDDFGEFDDFDYDAMLDEDDGGYEERIPGVNADPDEEDQRFSGPTAIHTSANYQQKPSFDENGYSATPYAGLTFAAQASNAAAPATFSMVSPIDENDQSMLSDFSLGGMQPGSGLIRQAGSSVSDVRESVSSVPNDFMHSPVELSRENTHESNNVLSQQGQAINSIDQAAGANNRSIADAHSTQSPSGQGRFSLTQALDDELYFDDGLLGEFAVPTSSGGVNSETGVPFDENIFDDENSYLYDRKRAARAAALEKAAQTQAQATNKQKSNLPVVAESPLRERFDADVRPKEDDIVQYDPEQFGKRMPLRPHNTCNEKAFPQDAANSELNGYHAALVEAMNKAALEGRFDRHSPSEHGNDVNEQADNSKATPTDSVQASSAGDHLQSEQDDMSSLVDDSEYDNMDEDYDNIIAAANAEVLENDDDGFYGLEFGFYANAPPELKAEDGQMIYGGYFGERGINMDSYTQGKNGLIHCSHSGRAADFQEPSLTPITERSEWSNRNSIISIPHSSYPIAPAGATSSSIPSNSSISQMASETTHSEELDMSYGALMKLRRDTFGGNNGHYNHGVTSNPSGSNISKSRIAGASDNGCVAGSPTSRRGSLLGTSPLHPSDLH